MKTHNKSLLLVATMTMALASVACGDAVTFNGDGGGGAGAGGGAGGNGGNGGDGGSGGDICAPFDDATGDAVTFRILNSTAQTIFVPTNCGTLAPEILPESGFDEVYYGNQPNGCFASCETLQEGEPPICTASACAETILELLPGQSHDFVWEGVGMTSATMPEACFFDSGWGTECTQVVEAAAQPMSFEVVAYDTCEGECICEDDGQCWGQAAGQMANHAPVVFEHGSDTLVNVVFEPCAFGCP